MTLALLIILLSAAAALSGSAPPAHFLPPFVPFNYKFEINIATLGALFQRLLALIKY
jgi:hypothetical protein